MSEKQRFLYRYRNLNSLNHRKDEINGKIFVTSPMTFNDYYDSYSIMSSEKVSTYLPVKNFESLGEETPYLVERTLLELCEDLNTEINKLLRSGAKIACFNKDYNNMPLWYHYADKYSGICLEYDVEKIPPQLIGFLDSVDYVERLPDGVKWLQAKRNASEKDLLKSMNEFYYSKLNDWRYENEWRLVLPIGVFYSSPEQIPDEKVYEGILIPFVKPNRVILGFKISKKNEQEIRKYCEEANVEVVKIKATQYGLKL